MDSIDLAQDRAHWRVLMNMVRSLLVLGKFLSNCTTGGLSRRAQFHYVSQKYKRPSWKVPEAFVWNMVSSIGLLSMILLISLYLTVLLFPKGCHLQLQAVLGV
jgi:hypothetical protein